MNETAYILHCLNNNESYVIMYWLVHKTYLFGDTHQWMSSYQNLKELFSFIHIVNDIATQNNISNVTSFVHTTSKKKL